METREFKYVPVEQARDVLLSREHLRPQVEAWWAEQGWGDLPLSGTLERPVAVQARAIATAKYEDCLFFDLAKRYGFTPMWAQLVEDQFFAGNPYKLSLVRNGFCSGRGENGGFKVAPYEFLRRAHKNKKKRAKLPADGARLVDIQDPQTGKGLVDLHNEFLKKALGIAPERIQDASSWYKEEGKTTADSFARYLSLFVGTGVVLFDDYHSGESGTAALADFRRRIFDPAIETTERLFGVQPLLVQPPSWAEMGWYPDPDAGNWRNHDVIPSQYR